MTPDERKQKVDSYATSHDRLMQALQTMPREMWQFKPAPEKWSIHEIIVHIADAELHSACRLRAFLAEPGKTVMGYDQDAYATKMKYHDHSVATALDLFRLIRQTNVSLLRQIDDSVWKNTVNHSDYGSMGLERWLEIYEAHVDKHIGQMQRNVETWKLRNKG